MRYFLAINIVVFLLHATGFSGWCIDTAPSVSSAPVKIKADTLSYDQRSGTYQASGDVEILWDTLKLFSDTALFNTNNNDAIAEGDVRLLKEGDVLLSDRLAINLGTEEGEMTNGDIFIAQSNMHIRGRKLSKVGKDEYILQEGSFTTCDGEVPSWKFTARSMDVTLEEYGVGRDALFYVNDIPIFYTPYIAFPVKRARQSGFLFPQP